MKKTYRHLLLTTALTSALFASIAIADETTYSPVLEISNMSSKKRTIGEINYMQPIWNNENDLIFADVKLKADTNKGKEVNVGLVYRHNLNDAVVLGVYNYFDYRKSGNNFSVAGYTGGVEALSKYVDARVNIYLPQNKKKKISKNSTKSVDIVGTSIFAKTSGDTYEHSYKGFDVEIGTPVFGFSDELNDKIGTKIFVAKYNFTSKGSKKISGLRFRMEQPLGTLELGNAGLQFMLNAETQYDNVRKRQYGAGISARLVFDENSKAGRRGKKAGLSSRMMDKVIRDVDIVTAENKAKDAIHTLEDQNGRKINNLYHVSGTSTTDGDGTKANPFTVAQLKTINTNNAIVVAVDATPGLIPNAINGTSLTLHAGNTHVVNLAVSSSGTKALLTHNDAKLKINSNSINVTTQHVEVVLAAAQQVAATAVGAAQQVAVAAVGAVQQVAAVQQAAAVQAAAVQAAAVQAAQLRLRQALAAQAAAVGAAQQAAAAAANQAAAALAAQQAAAAALAQQQQQQAAARLEAERERIRQLAERIAAQAAAAEAAEAAAEAAEEEARLAGGGLANLFGEIGENDFEVDPVAAAAEAARQAAELAEAEARRVAAEALAAEQQALQRLVEPGFANPGVDVATLAHADRELYNLIQQVEALRVADPQNLYVVRDRDYDIVNQIIADNPALDVHAIRAIIDVDGRIPDARKDNCKKTASKIIAFDGQARAAAQAGNQAGIGYNGLGPRDITGASSLLRLKNRYGVLDGDRAFDLVSNLLDNIARQNTDFVGGIEAAANAAADTPPTQEYIQAVRNYFNPASTPAVRLAAKGIIDEQISSAPNALNVYGAASRALGRLNAVRVEAEDQEQQRLLNNAMGIPFLQEPIDRGLITESILGRFNVREELAYALTALVDTEEIRHKAQAEGLPADAQSIFIAQKNNVDTLIRALGDSTRAYNKDDRYGEIDLGGVITNLATNRTYNAVRDDMSCPHGVCIRVVDSMISNHRLVSISNSTAASFANEFLGSIRATLDQLPDEQRAEVAAFQRRGLNLAVQIDERERKAAFSFRNHGGQEVPIPRAYKYIITNASREVISRYDIFNPNPKLQLVKTAAAAAELGTLNLLRPRDPHHADGGRLNLYVERRD